MGVRILAFAGSARRESLNKRALSAALPFLVKAGAEVTRVDLAEYRMPVYDGDLEEESGLPESAKRFKALMKEHPAFLLCTPEYNGSIPGPLKNVLDWASRPEEGEPVLACFQGKIAGLMSASPGALGGLRALAALRPMLQSIGTLVLPEQVAISKADAAFSGDGSFADPKRAGAVEKLAARLVDVSRRLLL